MNIYELTDGILSGISENYYHGMPEFAEGEEPERYIVYTVREAPRAYASGKYHAKEYWISVSVFTDYVDTEFYSEIEAAFTNAGASYSGGEDVGTDTLYPNKKHYSMDLILNFDIERMI